ncbi:discoidin domain-containing protein [Bradyrhizobium sp. B117]|uniref:discoidin domain-containing protein n=1 Tax=Bradyrhizobium sp. B117 TaxID=3140246 RepID=UPI003184624A
MNLKLLLQNIRLPIKQPTLVAVIHTPLGWLSAFRHFFSACIRIIVEEARGHLRLDVPLAIMAIVYLAAFAPVISRVTETPYILRCCISDEAPLSMALDGMRDVPYGDPFNFVLAPSKGKRLPPYWGKINYAGVGYYYGGVYMGLAFLIYAPLQALGLPPFPTAPIILRSLSLLAGLLALMMIYNFGRYHIGRFGASVGAAILLTDHYFNYYSSIIHPDTTQLMLAILGLAVAVRHLRKGDLESLGGLALISGLVQGTKLGGPWMIPMVALVTVKGLMLERGNLFTLQAARELVKRVLLLAGISLVTYFISTPYAFLSADFYYMTKIVLGLMSQSWLTPTNALSWISGLWTNFGAVVMAMALTAAILICINAIRGSVRWPMFVLLIFGLSQLLWYSVNGKLWVELGYMLGTFVAVALFAGELVEALGRLLARVKGTGRAGAQIVCALAIGAVIVGRWWSPAALALTWRATELMTSIEIGRWAEAGNIPRDARIIWDDSAFFDLNKFPNGYMYGLLTYNELYAYRPDYVILSSSVFGSPHFAQMRKTQRFTMQNEGPFSVRLYQDLLNSETSEPIAKSGIQYVRSFSEGARDCTEPSQPKMYEPWFGEAVPQRLYRSVIGLLGANPIGVWFAAGISAQAQYANHAGRMIDSIRGKICASYGPTIHVFRVIPPGTEQGFSQPLASSSWDGLSPLNAFDGDTQSYWMPSPNGADPEPWVGFDFGGGVTKSPVRVKIEWLKSDLVAPQVEIEYADWGQEWRSAGLFPIDTANSASSLTSEFTLPSGAGDHRLWRIVFHELTNRLVAVREIRFLDTKPADPSEAR